MSFAEHFANGPSLLSITGNLANLETECFCNSKEKLCCYPGDSGSQQRLLIFVLEILTRCDWILTLKWTWGCDPHWSSCWLNPNWGEESSQLALFGGSNLWSFVLIFYGSHVFCFPVEVARKCNLKARPWKRRVFDMCVLQTFGVAFAHGVTAVLVPCLPHSVTLIGGH